MDVVELTKELIDIPSESKRDGEIGVARYIADYLKRIGLEPELIRFNSSNADVVLSIGSGEGLMLNGHMDTVPVGDPSLWTNGASAKVTEERAYGRGASDMKGGIACMLTALANSGIASSKAKRRLLVAFVAGEETNFEGSAFLLDNRMDLFEGVKYGIIGEASFTGSIMNMQTAQKGAMDIGITFRGKAAHGSRPWLGDNAILKAIKFINSYQQLAENLKTEDKLLGKGSVNIGTINGGTASNVVPDTCMVEVDRRLVPGETAEEALGQVKSVLDTLGISAEISVPVSRGAYKLRADSKILEIMKRVTGENFREIGATGYTEAELYNARAGIDSVVFGPGEKEIIHQADEYVPIKNLHEAANVYEKVIREWCL